MLGDLERHKFTDAAICGYDVCSITNLGGAVSRRVKSGGRMTRLLEVLYQYLQAKDVTRAEFVAELVARGYADTYTAEATMDGEVEPCVSIVKAAWEILGLTDDEARCLRVAGMEDAREQLGSLQRV